MAGPAIRAWEFARALSTDYQVTLVSSHPVTCSGEGFQILHEEDPLLQELWKSVDVILTQTVTLDLAYRIWRQGAYLLVDAYDPCPLEVLEMMRECPVKEASLTFFATIHQLNFAFSLADGILCASEKQRDLWIGYLLGQQLISPALYRMDASLRHLIATVPFGLHGVPPTRTGPGLRKKYGFEPDDAVLLWGGGIWNWFDPLTLIQAIKLIHTSRKEVKLVFMGTQSPDPHVPAMSMCLKAIELAEKEGLLDKAVFFNAGWIPYQERQNFLLDATLGVSTHFDHLETRYAFRTRILDYIWAGLPIITTEGDSFADLVRSRQLGYVAPYENPEALAAAILALLDDKKQQNSIRTHLISLRKEFDWNHVVKPIQSMIENLRLKKPKTSLWNLIRVMSRLIFSRIRDKGCIGCLQTLYKKCTNRLFQINFQRNTSS